MVWGGRTEEGSGWGTHIYLWWIHFDIWQNQYNIVKLKNKIKLKKKEKKFIVLIHACILFLKFWIIFTIFTVNFFSGRLPISFLFI